jgi:hypothetical protein
MVMPIDTSFALTCGRMISPEDRGRETAGGSWRIPRPVDCVKPNSRASRNSAAPGEMQSPDRSASTTLLE